MRVFVLPAVFGGDDFLDLEGDDFHYLCRVRRLKEGDSLSAQDRQGNEYHISLEKVGRRGCRVRVQKKGSSRQAEHETELTLYQCLPKGTKFDTIVRQAVELGVSRIVPVRSRYSVPKIQDSPARLERWRRIAKEAVQQSGAAGLPEITQPVSLEDIAADMRKWAPKSLGIFFHQSPLETSALHGYLSLEPEKIALVIGPEGGLACEETEFLREAGFVPAYLGHRVLRTETAPVFAVAAVRIILLERKRWKLTE